METVIVALLVVAVALLAALLLRQSNSGKTSPDDLASAAEEQAQLLAELSGQVTAQMTAQMSTLQSQAIKQNSEQFLTLAQQRLKEETARGEEQLKTRQGTIDKGISEVRQEIGKLREFVQQVDTKRNESIVQLKTVAEESKQQTQLLRAETGRLNEALSGTQARGQWGERMAEDVLRVAGFVDGIQFRKQTQVDGGTSRPDFTFLVSDTQVLHMDVKTPMSGYQRFLESTNDHDRDVAAKEFMRDVRTRIKEVTTRDYIDPEGGTLDYTLVFIPNEQVYGFIHENDPALLDLALQNRVVLCSPLTLFAILAVIRQATENFQLAQQTDAILKALGGFNKQWQMFKDQMSKVDRALETSRKAFEDLTGTRKRGLDRQVERVEQLRKQAGIEEGGVEEGRITEGVIESTDELMAAVDVEPEAAALGSGSSV